MIFTSYYSNSDHYALLIIMYTCIVLHRPVSAPAVQVDDIDEEQRDMLSLAYHYPISTATTTHTLNAAPTVKKTIKKKGHIRVSVYYI